MGRVKKARKFASFKKMLSPKDPRLKSNEEKEIAKQKKAEKKEKLNYTEDVSSSMFFLHNTSLGPPYYIIIDTNFINFSIQNKLELVEGMMDCLLAKCIPCITDCVMAELEKLGSQFRLALRTAKDVRFHRISCTHKGTYADDCIVNLVTQDKIYIVATCDRDLRRRIRKIPGVPIMYIKSRKYTIERMPEAWSAPK